MNNNIKIIDLKIDSNNRIYLPELFNGEVILFNANYNGFNLIIGGGEIEDLTKEKTGFDLPIDVMKVGIFSRGRITIPKEIISKNPSILNSKTLSYIRFNNHFELISNAEVYKYIALLREEGKIK